MQGSNKGIKILLVEDNESDRYLLESILDTSVIKVDKLTPADSVACATELLEKESFHIIILDLTLPDSSGVETFRSIRNFSGKIPIIILSGLSDMKIAMEAILLGAQDYLLKDGLSESLLTKSILYSIERNKNIEELRNYNEQYLLIRKSELEAIKSLELASQIIHASMDSIVCIDKYGKIIAWNPQSVKLFGWQENEILGKTLTETIIPDEYKEIHETGIRIFMQTGKESFINKLIEIITIDKTGRRIPVEFNFVQINEDGTHFYCAFIRDVSLRKFTERKKEESIANKLILGDYTKSLSRVKDLGEIYSLTIDIIQKIFHVEKVAILLFNENLKIEYVADRNLSEKYKKAVFGFDLSPYEEQMALPHYVEEINKELVGDILFPFLQEEGIVSLVYIPLIHQQKLLGRVMLYFSEKHTYSNEEKLLIETIAGNLSFSVSEIRILDDLKKSEEKYRTLIEQASDPIIIYSLDGKIIDYNTLFMSSTGYTKKDVKDLRLVDLLFKEDLKTRPLVFDKIITGDPVQDIRNVRRKNGSMMFAELNSKKMPDGNVMVIARDITERKKTEAALKESEAKYRTLVEKAVDAIALYNADGIVFDTNAGAVILLGYEKDELIGMSLKDILTPEEMELNPIRYDILQSGDSTIRQWKMKRKDGSIVETEVRSQQLPDGLFLSVIRDLTERLKSERQLEESYEAIRRLTSHIQNIREEERTEIAKIIHDDLGQKLTVLKMDISWLKLKIEDNNESVGARVNEILKMLDETVATVRRLSLDLRPSLLDDLGLVPAMEWHLEEFENRFKIATKFVHEIDETELSDAVKTSFFRIFQESLTNVGEHSQAECVTITIIKREKSLTLSIDDNGIGFNTQTQPERKTLGILGMEERMSTIGGKYMIKSEKGKGTEVLVQLQLN